METAKEELYLGIELNDRYAMVSYFNDKMKEPETVSEIAGEDYRKIPLLLAKTEEDENWVYGEDARRLLLEEGACVDHLLRRALAEEMIQIGEECYPAEELLAVFVRKLIGLSQTTFDRSKIRKLVFCVEKLNKPLMEVLWKVCDILKFPRERMLAIDHKESFYYFLFHQSEELYNHGVFLFEWENVHMRSYFLQRNRKTVPQLITVTESEPYRIGQDRDKEFLKILEQSINGKIISSVYLVGEEFDGGWMKESIAFMCRSRRAFMGHNLFSQGACYAGIVAEQEDWNFVYIGENDMKYNLSLQVEDGGQQQFVRLISAGRNWFELRGQCEVILDELDEILFWKQKPNSQVATIDKLKLTGLPVRPNKTTRLRIEACPVSDEEIEITIRDLGFGEFFRATDKSWKYKMTGN